MRKMSCGIGENLVILQCQKVNRLFRLVIDLGF